jgi:hypothetical protein
MMYDLVGLFGVSGAGKDTAASLIVKFLPTWRSVGVSEPLLRECERREGLEAGFLDTGSEKRKLRAVLSQLAAELLANDPLWMIERCLAYPRPLVVVGPRPLAHLQPLQDMGALMVEIRANREVRIARIGQEAVILADQDAYEKEMLTFTGERLFLNNNGSLNDLEESILKQIIPSLRSA